MDKATWEAVQEEFERRENFMNEHGLTKYVYGAEYNPFSSRVFCGKCGHSYTKHTWKKRGVEQWQCKNHRTNGKLTCKNEFVDSKNLEQAFVKAFNIDLTDKVNIQKWEQMKREGTALQRIRAEQMISIVAEGEIKAFVPELAQLVTVSVTVHGARSFEFEFMDGSRITV